MLAAGDVGKGLVDGDPLDQRGEITDDRDRGIAKTLVLREMAVDKNQRWTELARPPPRHAAADAEGPGFIRSGEYDTATYGNGLAAQRRVEQLLDRGVEGIEVGVEDGCRRCHQGTRARIFCSKRPAQSGTYGGESRRAQRENSYGRLSTPRSALGGREIDRASPWTAWLAAPYFEPRPGTLGGWNECTLVSDRPRRVCG
jgi:hypothetical protein